MTYQSTLPNTPKFIVNRSDKVFILYAKSFEMAKERAKGLWPDGDFTVRLAESKDDEVLVIDGRYGA